MANKILILGETGRGKSRSIKNLEPSETFIIRVIDKDLPFKGWDSKYSQAETSTTGSSSGNIITTRDSVKICSIMEHINTKRPEIKTI